MPSKILVSTHKAYTFPQDKLYVPIHVGRVSSSVDLGIVGDDTGENISEKNQSFCELTGLYWAWKNKFFEKSDFCGMMHYRRYFKGDGAVLKGKSVLSSDEVKRYLSDYDMILPKKRHYVVESVREHYANAHYTKDMEVIAEILAVQEPSYVEAFETVMNNRSLHLFNMFVMRPKLFDDYMSWLFPLIFALEKEIDITDYDDYQKRVFGYIAERLFNVWIVKNDFKVKTIPVQSLEGENLLLKAIGLLKRKFVKKRK